MAISNPPPTAMPLTAAITGVDALGQFGKSAEAADAVVAVELLACRRGPNPAEKNFGPAPVRMIARIVGVAVEPANASPIALLVAASIALAFGRSMVTTAVPPCDLDVESGHSILLQPQGVDCDRAAGVRPAPD